MPIPSAAILSDATGEEVGAGVHEGEAAVELDVAVEVGGAVDFEVAFDVGVLAVLGDGGGAIAEDDAAAVEGKGTILRPSLEAAEVENSTKADADVGEKGGRL